MDRRRVTRISFLPGGDANETDTLCFGNHLIQKIMIVLGVAILRHAEALDTDRYLPGVNRTYDQPVDSKKIKRAGRTQRPGLGLSHHLFAASAGRLVKAISNSICKEKPHTPRLNSNIQCLRILSRQQASALFAEHAAHKPHRLQPSPIEGHHHARRGKLVPDPVHSVVHHPHPLIHHPGHTVYGVSHFLDVGIDLLDGFH